MAILLFLFLTAAYALTSSGRIRAVDEYLMYYQTESLVLRHSLAIPQSVEFGNFFGIYDRFHEPRTPFPPGLALAAFPSYEAGLAAVSAMHLPPQPAMFLLEFAACMTNAVLAAATVAVLFLFLARLGFACRTALITAFLIAFTSMLWPYSGYFFSEVLASLLLILAAFVLFADEPGPAGYSTRALVIAGALLGLLVWVRFYHMIALVAFCLSLMAVEKRLRPAVIIASIPCISLALYLAYNHYLFGGFFRFAYPTAVEAGIHPTSFPTPLWLGVAGMLFSPGKSVFLFIPLVIPAIWGLKSLWQRNRGLVIMLSLLPVIYLLFFAKYVNWEGGRAPGPRYLLPPAGLLCVAVAPLLESASRRARLTLWATAVAGFLVQVVSMATSFLEAHVGYGYYNSQYQYQFFYCQFTVQLQLLWHYAMGAPHRLGTGWDRWFLFLHEGGIPTSFIAMVLTAECLALLVFSYFLRREYRRCMSLGNSSAHS